MTREKCGEPLRQIFGIEGLAFPEDQDIPTEHPQLALLYSVSLDVALEFVCPKDFTCLRRGCTITTPMSMPEATVNEYDLSHPWEDQVWCSRKIATVKSKAIA